jgi:hypothetical protein
MRTRASLPLIAVLFASLALAAASGCGNAAEVRLDFRADYVAPARPSAMNEHDWAEYSRGYEAGWMALAARWKAYIAAGGAYVEEGSYIDCRKDSSPYQRGIEEGEGAAMRLAESKYVTQLL